MQEIVGDIWNQYDKGRWIVITTNGDVKKDGACVMGRGVARQASLKIPSLPYRLGEMIKESGNQVYIWSDLKIITFPVKYHWREQADFWLIEQSLKQLVGWADLPPRKHGKFYIVRAGTGNGGLSWDDVKPLFEKYLDDRFIVVSKENDVCNS